MKLKWFGQTLRRRDDSVGKQVYSEHRKAAEEGGDPGTPGKKDPEKEIWTWWASDTAIIDDLAHFLQQTFKVKGQGHSVT